MILSSWVSVGGRGLCPEYEGDCCSRCGFTVRVSRTPGLHSLSVLLHFTIHPAVFLLGDEQDDDVSLVEAEQCVVVAGGVGEDGAHAGLLRHVVEAGGHRHGPGEAVVLTVIVGWKEQWVRSQKQKGSS